MASASSNVAGLQIALRGLNQLFAGMYTGARCVSYTGIALVIISGVGLLISRTRLKPDVHASWLTSLDNNLRNRCDVETSTLGHFASQTLNMVASLRRSFIMNFCNRENRCGRAYPILLMLGALAIPVGIAEYYTISRIHQSLIHDLEVKAAGN
ncbi:MAG TPA: hypothetical protein VMR37_06815 [Rhabdochlamydiaceae bacterium]|nr:hypothetical protein [Rhabdochlamydiaceae bacterium]